MIQLTTKTVLAFEPGLSNAVPVDGAAEDKYTTPSEFSHTLGDLARLSYLNGEFRYRVELDAASASGSADIELRSGAVVIATATLDLTSAQTFRGSMNADITNVVGGSVLTVALKTTVAGGAGRTAQVAGQLIVDSPLVIGID